MMTCVKPEGGIKVEMRETAINEPGLQEITKIRISGF
jgi:hypothetical protein